MSNFGTSAIAPGVNIPNQLNFSDKTKKNVATVSLLGLAGVGAKAISKNTFGKSFAWNTKINNTLKSFAKNVANFAEKNSIAAMFSKTKAGKVVGNAIQTVANKGAGLVQEVASQLSKTTGRQKLLGALALGTLATVMAVREHYAKKDGENTQKSEDAQKAAILKNAYQNKLDAKNDKIFKLEADAQIKDAEIKALRKTIADVEKAAENIGVDRQMEAEMHKMTD